MHNYETLIVLQSSHMVLNRNLKDISHPESLVTPAQGGNSINWILGHIIVSRDDIRELIGLDKLYGEDMKMYQRGAEAVSTDKLMDFSKLLEMFNTGQNLLVDKLKETDLRGDNEKYRMVTFLAFHEAYHAGQTGILRRIIGKEGAIR
ncbi:MAG TPA: DinB family protein [Ignavibacteria bacterium]|nr:hypothetical protein [Bacteroidota bacterium]HRE09963.1 DinB family protein [Ignavibacteria bacterium]HRF66969.1 DinB family protein [Ignavibacteria bacterium]HRJ04815.1 DinB family protein [Ignavibacteria bacterium]